MKLIKCYVENFGTLSKYSLSFSDNLTIIKEDNGFGKSTLATFIKAMFYGLPKSKKSNRSIRLDFKIRAEIFFLQKKLPATL